MSQALPGTSAAKTKAAVNRPERRDDIQQLYQNLAVGSDPNKIRLLELHAGLPHTALKVTLRVADLSASPEYEALSYTWGESKRCRKLCVSRRYSLAITDNLDRALRGLRKVRCNRTLWVDAICINQFDGSEKGDQVSNMGRVFKSATCVNVWFGNSSWHTMPIDLSESIKYFLLTPFSGLGTRDEPSIWRVLLRNYLGKIDSATSATLPRWDERIWVVQEYIMAQRVYFCLGNRRWLCDEDIFGRYLKLCPKRSHFSAFFVFNRIQSSLNPIKEAMEFKDGSSNIDILHGVAYLGGSTATDPRDMIYGLMAFFSEEERTLLQPDYNLPCWKVFARATFVSIVLRGNFDILTLLHYPGDWPGLPTWTMDFDNIAKRTIYSLGPGVLRGKRSQRQRFGEFVALDPSYRYLTVHGISCDSIEGVEIFKTHSNTEDKNRLHEFLGTAVDSAYNTMQDDITRASSWMLNQYMSHCDLSSMDRSQWEARYVEMISRDKVEENFRRILKNLFEQNPRGGLVDTAMWWDREMFATHHGLFGLLLSHSKLKPGDNLVIVNDEALLFVLRPAGEYHEFIGIALIQQQVSKDLWVDLLDAGFEDEIQDFVLC